VKVKVTIKNVNFTQMDLESKQELRAALQTTIADKAGVDETAVNITLTAGSVKVSAVIDLEERIGVMEGESEGQDVDLASEMESLKNEVQSDLETGDVKQDILTVASSVEGVQLAAEGEISVTDPETSVTVQESSTDTKPLSVEDNTAPELQNKTTPIGHQETPHQQLSSPAAVQYNVFVSMLVGGVMASALH